MKKSILSAMMAIALLGGTSMMAQDVQANKAEQEKEAQKPKKEEQKATKVKPVKKETPAQKGSAVKPKENPKKQK